MPRSKNSSQKSRIPKNSEVISKSNARAIAKAKAKTSAKPPVTVRSVAKAKPISRSQTAVFGTSIISLAHLGRGQVYAFLDRAHSIDLAKSAKVANRKRAALLFFEPSTRTRLSFELAFKQEGFDVIAIEGTERTSLEKGETFLDTVLNIEAMGIDAFVIRGDANFPFLEVSKFVKAPIYCGGWGSMAHPTQALLDALTLRELRPQLADLKVLFVGDVLHSRVFSSHAELSQILGYRIGVSAPSFLLPTSDSKVSRSVDNQFEKLEDGLKWADAVVFLRYQKERHSQGYGFDNIKIEFGLNPIRQKLLKQNALILHPGPVDFGLELERKVLSDKRCRIHEQVANGVRVRRALVSQV